MNNVNGINGIKSMKSRLVSFFVLLGVAVCIVILFSAASPEVLVMRKDASGQRVAVRDFPYPYSAMVALVNDCDNTAPRSFERYHRFLNTFDQTIYGAGLGLDISDSFFAYTAAADYNSVMTYFLGVDPGEPKDARRIERYIRAGWIDALHTYGDFSILQAPDEEGSGGGASLFTRELALAAFQSLKSAGIFPIVWTDHGNEGNVQNIGSYGFEYSSRYKRGDSLLSQEYYHADATLAGGVKYVWDAKSNNNFGYEFPMFARTLRDGRKVWSFSRYTGESGIFGDVTWDWYPERLRYTLTEERLSELVRKRQYGLFAQHLGFYGEDYIFDSEDVAALRRLASYQHEQGAILVARTSRLLEYAVARKFVSYTAYSAAGAASETNTAADQSTNLYIDIISIGDPLFPDPEPMLDRVRGLTFYCDDPSRAALLLCGAPIDESEIVRNTPDETGRPSIAIRWYEHDAVDYSDFG